MTPVSFVYDVIEWPYNVIIYGDGDGTINMRSQQVFQRWKNDQLVGISKISESHWLFESSTCLWIHFEAAQLKYFYNYSKNTLISNIMLGKKSIKFSILIK